MYLLRRPISFSDRIPDRFYVTSMEFLWLSRRCRPRETSPAARSEKKRLFSQARRMRNPLLHYTCRALYRRIHRDVIVYIFAY